MGNDIVDLAYAKQQSNWQRRGFLDKVFTAHEQHLIHTAKDPDQVVWLLWSLKESVYKLAIRQTNNRVFAPQKIACFLNSPTQEIQTGRVVYETGTYETTSTLTTDYIATIAFIVGPAPTYTHGIVSFVNATYSTQYHTIREYVKQQYAARLGVSEQAIRIHKNKAGAPELTVGNESQIPISLSHHGRYGSYGIPY